MSIVTALGEETHAAAGSAKKLIDLVLEISVKYGFQVLGGVVVLLIGWVVGNFTAQFVRNLLGGRKVDVTITKFVTSITKLVVVAFAGIVALDKFGVEITL